MSGCFAEQVEGNQEEGGFSIEGGHGKERDEDPGGFAEVDEVEAEREEHEAGHVVEKAEILHGVQDEGDGAQPEEERVHEPTQQLPTAGCLVKADRDPSGDENTGNIEVELGDATGPDSAGEEVAISGEVVGLADHERAGERPAEKWGQQKAGLEGKALVPVGVAVEVDIRMAQEQITADELNGHEEEEGQDGGTQKSGTIYTETSQGSAPALLELLY